MNLKPVERKCCETELIHTFSNLALCSQTLANTDTIFQNMYHVDLLEIIRNGVGFIVIIIIIIY